MLIDELEALINKHSVENESDTPDFILAKYLGRCLDNWNETVTARDKWWGFKPWGNNEGIEVTEVFGPSDVVSQSDWPDSTTDR